MRCRSCVHNLDHFFTAASCKATKMLATQNDRRCVALRNPRLHTCWIEQIFRRLAGPRAWPSIAAPLTAVEAAAKLSSRMFPCSPFSLSYSAKLKKRPPPNCWGFSSCLSEVCSWQDLLLTLQNHKSLSSGFRVYGPQESSHLALTLSNQIALETRMPWKSLSSRRGPCWESKSRWTKMWSKDLAKPWITGCTRWCNRFTTGLQHMGVMAKEETDTPHQSQIQPQP